MDALFDDGDAAQLLPLVNTGNWFLGPEFANNINDCVPACEGLSDRLRRRRRADRRHAAALQFNSRTLRAQSDRLSDCERGCFGDVSLLRNATTNVVKFRGIKRCGSVWCCPVCAPSIAAKRVEELCQMQAECHRRGYSVVLLTLTARHDRSMRLAPFLTALKKAKQAFRQRIEWTRYAGPLMFGSVTTTEITHGLENGWHPHFHELLAFDLHQEEALALMNWLKGLWLHCLRRYGLTGNDAAYNVQGADAAWAYVGKFGGLAEELALSALKQGRGTSSRTPWQLLSDSRDGDKQAGALFVEYGEAVLGRRQLVWSRGLKKACGIEEVEDSEFLESEDDESETEASWEVIRTWSPRAWVDARRRFVSILLAAERGQDLESAERGPTDVEIFNHQRTEDG